LPSTARAYAAVNVRPIWMPDGSGVLVAVPQANGTQTLYRADLKTGECREAAPLGRFVTGGLGLRAAISADARMLYVRGTVTKSWDDVHLDRITTVDLDTGEQREIVKLPPPYLVDDLALSPDGRTLSFVGMNWDGQKQQAVAHVLARVDVDGSGYRELTRDVEPAQGAMSMKWSADGGAVLLSRVDASGAIRLMRIPADGGHPELTGVVAPPRTVLDVEPKRLRVAVATPSRSFEIWTLEHLPAALSRSR
jgi:dipeptidyl aminopeptidase/acylaminoacyl peptidase